LHVGNRILLEGEDGEFLLKSPERSRDNGYGGSYDREGVTPVKQFGAPMGGGQAGVTQGSMGQQMGAGQVGQNQGSIGQNQGSMGQQMGGGQVGQNQGSIGQNQGSIGQQMGGGQVGQNQGSMGQQMGGGQVGQNQGSMGQQMGGGQVGQNQGSMGQNQGSIGRDQAFFGDTREPAGLGLGRMGLTSQGQSQKKINSTIMENYGAEDFTDDMSPYNPSKTGHTNALNPGGQTDYGKTGKIPRDFLVDKTLDSNSSLIPGNLISKAKLKIPRHQGDIGENPSLCATVLKLIDTRMFAVGFTDGSISFYNLVNFE
jgi:hypothetical protein